MRTNHRSKGGGCSTKSTPRLRSSTNDCLSSHCTYGQRHTDVYIHPHKVSFVRLSIPKKREDVEYIVACLDGIPIWRRLTGQQHRPFSRARKPVPLLLSRVTIATTSYQQGKTNLSFIPFERYDSRLSIELIHHESCLERCLTS